MSADEQVSRRSLFTARLYRLLDEQRIDVLMVDPLQPDTRSVVTSARRQGVQLALT